MAPSEMVAWECGACTFTNEDVQRRICQMCMTERPLRYDIVPGAAGAASARTTTVNRREQARLAIEAHLVAARDAEEDPPPPAAVEEPIAEGVPLAPSRWPVAAEPRRVVVERLVGTLVDVVGTTATNRGRSCFRHSCCGSQVAEKSTVAFRREQLIFREGREEDVIAVYVVVHGVMMCKVGFLPAHLNRRARDYDGLIARVISVYTDRCTNVVKRQKYWRNNGCCVARIVGEHVVV